MGGFHFLHTADPSNLGPTTPYWFESIPKEKDLATGWTAVSGKVQFVKGYSNDHPTTWTNRGSYGGSTAC